MDCTQISTTVNPSSTYLIAIFALTTKNILRIKYKYLPELIN